MIIDFILSLGLILPGLSILQLMKIRLDSVIEQITLSYIFSLVIMFGLLYLGALSYSFKLASFIYLISLIVSFFYLIIAFIYKKLYISFRQFLRTNSIISIEKLILIISTAAMLLFYAIYLYKKAILDSDVVQYYLPIAREIVRQNGFTYRTGYDYNILLKPIGASVIYAWTYIVSGSILAEDFRLMPLVPLLILIILNYAIATSATNSEKIGLLSTLLYLVFPFHDRFLFYNSFYPDIFYYPLIFSVIYFFIKYSYSRRSELLIWIGMSLGCAALLKAQTVYFVITILVMFFILQLKTFKKLSIMFCAIAPFLLLIPAFLASSVQRGGIRISVPSLTETQLVVLLFLSFLCIISYYVILFRIRENTKVGKPSLKEIIKESMFLFLPFILLTSLWYVANLFRFGTLLYTSSLNLPNYDWALKILQNLSRVQPHSSPWHYILLYLFMFIDPAVMGYAMLIPLLIGMASILSSKNKFKSFNLLFLFEIISSSIIFSSVIVTQSAAYNPRDIFPLTPLLTSSVATGIAFVSLTYRERSNNTAEIFISLLLIIYFGFLAYIHSVLVYYASDNYRTVTGTLMSSLANMVGLNLKQTSFQLPYYERIVFISENFQKIFLLSVITGLPLIILLSFSFMISSARILRFKYFNIRFKLEKIFFKAHLLKYSRLIETGLILSLLLSTILIPRIEIIMVYGGLNELRKNQLKNSYGSLYMLLVDPKDLKGGILTFESPMGLPYYMPDSKVIDLQYPANLAFLKDCLLSNNSYEIIVKLKSLGINYILINPSGKDFKTLDESLNFGISRLIGNPELVLQSKSFGNWKLYNLGPYEVDKIRLPLGGWSVDSRSTLTNARYVFNTNETGIFLVLYPTDINSRVTIFTKTIPKLNLSDYDYVIVRLKGSNNARILVRFFMNDGSGFDVAYWQDPYTLMTAPFDLRPYTGKILNGYLFVALKSSDGLPSSLYLYEISFIKIKR